MTRAQEYISLKTWAVVGASENPEKYGYKIATRLLQAGKEVYGVNPRPGSIGSIRFFPDLASLPKLPDIVDLVVPPLTAVEAVRECAKIGIKRIWFQPGTRSPEASTLCVQLGISAVEDSCVLIELDKLNL